MGKIIVIYHSQQYGNTKMLAEALMVRVVDKEIKRAKKAP